jgi:hypothetical protein
MRSMTSPPIAILAAACALSCRDGAPSIEDAAVEPDARAGRCTTGPYTPWESGPGDGGASDGDTAGDPESPYCSNSYNVKRVRACRADEVCVALQPLQAEVRVCLPTCRLGQPQSCAAGFECSDAYAAYAGQNSVCVPLGDGQPGDHCTQGSFSLCNGCRSDTVCFADRCRSRCDFWAVDPGCPTGQRCSWDVCSPLAGDPALLGGTCRKRDLPFGSVCGADDKRYRGICSGPPSKPQRCLARCRADSDCRKGERCTKTEWEQTTLCAPS